MQHLIMQYTANPIMQILNIPCEDFIGNFLYGSQNYQLDYEGSDIDTILIVRAADKPKQEMMTSIGKTKIYTLKYFLHRLQLGDLECYEILYTKHKILNPMYADYFVRFVQEFSNCMSYERIKLALCKKLNEHLCHVLWILSNPEKARYNKKRLYWAIRVCNQLQRINEGEDFESSLLYRSSWDCDLIKIKTITNYLSLKEFNEIYKYLVNFLRSLPHYDKDVSDEEEACISAFYRDVTKIGIEQLDTQI